MTDMSSCSYKLRNYFLFEWIYKSLIVIAMALRSVPVDLPHSCAALSCSLAMLVKAQVSPSEAWGCMTTQFPEAALHSSSIALSTHTRRDSIAFSILIEGTPTIDTDKGGEGMCPAESLSMMRNASPWPYYEHQVLKSVA